MPGVSSEEFNSDFGWELKEIYSTDNQLTHRYYFHRGPAPDAPVFLFLHGLFLDGRGFEKMHSLSQKWQLIAYDFPESSKAYRGDMNDFRFLLDDFLDLLKIDQFFLCGVSFGGGVALRYAASHSRRIRALILVSTFIMNATHRDRMKSRLLANIVLKNADNKLQWLIGKVVQISFGGIKNPLNNVIHMVNVRNIDWYRQVVRSITTCEGTEDAVQIKCPVLALYGDEDRTVPAESAHLIPVHIPSARFELIEKGSHVMAYLQGELLAQKIINFCGKMLNSEHSSENKIVLK